jgi:hypothetical protein
LFETVQSERVIQINSREKKTQKKRKKETLRFDTQEFIYTGFKYTLKTQIK